MLDILIGLFTGYFEKGQLVTDKRKIALNWVHNFMFTDLISTLPIVVKLIIELLAADYY